MKSSGRDLSRQTSLAHAAPSRPESAEHRLIFLSAPPAAALAALADSASRCLIPFKLF